MTGQLVPVAIPATEAEEEALILAEASNDDGSRFVFKPGVMVYSGGVFKVEDSNFVATEIDAVILDSIVSRTLWPDRGDDRPPAGEQPICSSLGGKVGNLTDPMVGPERWNGRCAACGANEWGSDPKGGRGKACSEARILLLRVDGLRGPIRMRLATSSISNFDSYLSGLARQKVATAWYSVVTHMSLASAGTGSIKYYTVSFKMLQRLHGAQLAEAVALKRQYAEVIGSVLVEEWAEKAASNEAAGAVPFDDAPPPDDDDAPPPF